MTSTFATPSIGSVVRLNSGRIIAVASGKGGVGKTWLSITLAHALARAGERVLLFDADLGLANVDIQLGLIPPHDLGSVLTGLASMEAACIAHEGGFDTLTGRSGSGDLAGLDDTVQRRIGQLLTRAANRYTTVILDLGAGLDPFVRKMAGRADILLVVATDEPTSLTDAYAVLKLHQRDVAPRATVTRIVINQAQSRALGLRTYKTLARAAEQFLGHSPPLACIVRRDEKVRDAIRHQTLLLTRHPTADAGMDVTDLAKRLSPG